MATKTDELQLLLEEVLGSENVYFQAPPDVYMKYPAIRYGISDIYNRYADGKKYKRNTRYDLTLIDYDPEPDTINKLLELPYCEFDRHYVTNNLNHFTFTLYY